MRVIALAALCLSTSLTPPDALPICVRAGQTKSADGFVQPVPQEFQDSARDLATQLAKDKGLQLVPTDETAAAIVLVTWRGTHSESNGGAMTVPVGQMVMTVPTSAKWKELQVVVRVGTHDEHFGSTCQSWGDCAKKVSQSVRAWLAANRQMIAASRK